MSPTLGLGSQSCDEYEDERIQMSVRQPQSMVNYTSTGFRKIKAPESLFSLLKTHYELNRGRSIHNKNECSDDRGSV
jgi:prolyl 4-hydroxylase